MKSNAVIGVYNLLRKIAGSGQSLVLLILRLYWGGQFFQAGKGKLADLDRTAEFFAKLDIPAPKLNAAMAGSTECFGGLLLLLGLGSRAVSIPLAFTMIVAYMTAHKKAAKEIFNDPDTFVTQAPFLFLLVSVIVLVFGPGKFSVDYILQKTVFRNHQPPMLSGKEI